MRSSTRRKLASRFRYSKFAQLLIYSPWFRAAVIAMVLLGLAAALMLPKIWNVAPAGWTQEIRISGLDVLQAWSLSRTAERQERTGKPDAALYSWGAALANYPTRPALCRVICERRWWRQMTSSSCGWPSARRTCCCG
jgi:hypothetical protein